MAIARDKKLHLAAGSTVSLIFCLGFLLFNQSYWVIGGCGIGILAGVIKEIYDKIIKGTKFDVADLGYTTLGSVLTSISLYLIVEIIKRGL